MSASIIRDKSFDFSLKIISLFKSLNAQKEYVFSKQLLKSGTSIGANVEEALAGQSKKDFLYKMALSLKEARETRYWLLLLKESDLVNLDRDDLIRDVEERIKILTSIVKTSKQNLNSSDKTTRQ